VLGNGRDWDIEVGEVYASRAFRECIHVRGGGGGLSGMVSMYVRDWVWGRGGVSWGEMVEWSRVDKKKKGGRQQKNCVRSEAAMEAW
jgi:hypothetical protein